MNKILTFSSPLGIALIALFIAGVMITNSFASEKVTVLNYPRAETDKFIKIYGAGSFGKMFHVRKPTPIDQQDVIRMNRDTLYSAGIFDLNSPVTINKPDTGDRYQSMQVINQDHYIKKFAYEPGKYTFTKDEIGTRGMYRGFGRADFLAVLNMPRMTRATSPLDGETESEDL